MSASSCTNVFCEIANDSEYHFLILALEIAFFLFFF